VATRPLPHDIKVSAKGDVRFVPQGLGQQVCAQQGRADGVGLVNDGFTAIVKSLQRQREREGQQQRQQTKDGRLDAMDVGSECLRGIVRARLAHPVANFDTRRHQRHQRQKRQCNHFTGCSVEHLGHASSFPRDRLNR
jgi:hypothetical protein